MLIVWHEKFFDVEYIYLLILNNQYINISLMHYKKQESISMEPNQKYFVNYYLQISTGNDYGGTDKEGNLEGSTKGWDYYFEHTPKGAPKFEKVYYLPVWKDEFSIENNKKFWFF